MSEKNNSGGNRKKKKRTYPEGKTSVSPGSAENPGRKKHHSSRPFWKR